MRSHSAMLVKDLIEDWLQWYVGLVVFVVNVVQVEGGLLSEYFACKGMHTYRHVDNRRAFSNVKKNWDWVFSHTDCRQIVILECVSTCWRNITNNYLQCIRSKGGRRHLLCVQSGSQTPNASLAASTGWTLCRSNDWLTFGFVSPCWAQVQPWIVLQVCCTTPDSNWEYLFDLVVVVNQHEVFKECS